jgi:hypothetical protein
MGVRNPKALLAAGSGSIAEGFGVVIGPQRCPGGLRSANAFFEDLRWVLTAVRESVPVR